MSDPREPVEAGEERDLGENEEAEDLEGDDAGVDDEEADDAAADDAEGEGEEGQARNVRPRSRGENRFQRLSNENEALRRRLDDLDRRSQEPPRQAPADPQAQARARQEFVERLRLMDPVDAALELERVAQQQIGGAMQSLEARLLDRQDKRDFDRSCQTDRTRQRLSPEVDKMIAEARRQGNYTLDRETAYLYQRGLDVERRVKAETPRQRAAAQRRVASQTTRPGSGRGDAARTGGRRTVDADEALLRGLRVGDL